MTFLTRFFCAALLLMAVGCSNDDGNENAPFVLPTSDMNVTEDTVTGRKRGFALVFVWPLLPLSSFLRLLWARRPPTTYGWPITGVRWTGLTIPLRPGPN